MLENIKGIGRLIPFNVVPSSPRLPAQFEVEWDTVTNGNAVQQIIVDIRPPKAEVKKPGIA